MCAFLLAKICNVGYKIITKQHDLHPIRKSSPDVDATNTADTLMRQTFDPQPRLGTMPIENLTFNPRQSPAIPSPGTIPRCSALPCRRSGATPGPAIRFWRLFRNPIMKMSRVRTGVGGFGSMDVWPVVSSSGVCRDEAGPGS